MAKNTGKVRKKSGNFVSLEKWEPCHKRDTLLVEILIRETKRELPALFDKDSSNHDDMVKIIADWVYFLTLILLLAWIYFLTRRVTAPCSPHTIQCYNRLDLFIPRIDSVTTSPTIDEPRIVLLMSGVVVMVWGSFIPKLSLMSQK